MISKIDKDADWTEFVRLCAEKSGRIQKTDAFHQDTMVMSSNKVFGVSLEELVVNTPDMVPTILKQCASVVEEYGLSSVGIYRLSGTSSKIQKMKLKFEHGDPNPISEEDLTDINNITGVLKLWFRELPNPLFPAETYYEFLEAASKGLFKIACHLFF